MLDIKLQTPFDIRQELATRVKERRLFLNITQKTLAEKSGVSQGSIKRFESTGEISLSHLLSLALVLDELESFANLFAPRVCTSLFEKKPPKRKRARG